MIVLCSCGETTRTSGLKVMSLASYQLLHSAMLFLKCECKGKCFISNHQKLWHFYIAFLIYVNENTLIHTIFHE